MSLLQLACRPDLSPSVNGMTSLGFTWPHSNVPKYRTHMLFALPEGPHCTNVRMLQLPEDSMSNDGRYQELLTVMAMSSMRDCLLVDEVASETFAKPYVLHKLARYNGVIQWCRDSNTGKICQGSAQFQMLLFSDYRIHFYSGC